MFFSEYIRYVPAADPEETTETPLELPYLLSDKVHSYELPD